jgi:hypothetical protein
VQWPGMWRPHGSLPERPAGSERRECRLCPSRRVQGSWASSSTAAPRVAQIAVRRLVGRCSGPFYSSQESSKSRSQGMAARRRPRVPTPVTPPIRPPGSSGQLSGRFARSSRHSTMTTRLFPFPTRGCGRVYPTDARYERKSNGAVLPPSPAARLPLTGPFSGACPTLRRLFASLSPVCFASTCHAHTVPPVPSPQSPVVSVRAQISPPRPATTMRRSRVPRPGHPWPARPLSRGCGRPSQA